MVPFDAYCSLLSTMDVVDHISTLEELAVSTQNETESVKNDQVASDVAKTWSRAVTEIRVQKLFHEWVVKNFSHIHQEYLENFVTLTRSEERFVYSVKIYPKGSGDNNKDFAFLCLNRLPQTTAKTPKNAFKCRFSLRNAEGHPIHVRVHPSPSHSDYVSYLKRETLFSQIQPHDVLVVNVEIDVVIETVNTVLTDEFCMVDSSVALSNNFLSLLRDATLSDFTVKVGTDEIAVHRCVLAARSSVFNAMLTHDTEEARKCTVDICDFDVDVVRDLIRFMYTGRVKDIKELTPDLLILADKYDVEDLKMHCERSLASALSSENCCELLMLADSHVALQLRRSAMHYIGQHIGPVTATAGWMMMLKQRPELVTEVVRDLQIDRLNYADVS